MVAGLPLVECMLLPISCYGTAMMIVLSRVWLGHVGQHPPRLRRSAGGLAPTTVAGTAGMTTEMTTGMTAGPKREGKEMPVPDSG